MGKQYTQACVTYLLVFGFFLAIWYISSYPVPQENKDIANILVGALSAKFCDAISYWLGSTRSSQAKDEVIAQGIPNK